MFPYFQIFGKTIGTYGICAVVGLLCCGWLACILAKRFAVAYEDVILLMLVIGGSLLVGGHLLYGITNVKILVQLFTNASALTVKQFIMGVGVCFGGMVFYGGFLGACVGLRIYTGVSKSVERGIAFDLFAVCIPLFHVFGRIGCFFSGCCYGIESSFGFVVRGNTLIPEINDVRRLPVALIEAGCNLVIFLILLRMFQKGKEKDKMIFYYMLMYPAVRFVLEFFRGDALRGFLFGLSTSQWISIALFATAVWMLFLRKSKGRKPVICAGVMLIMTLAVGMTMPATMVYGTEDKTQTVTETADVLSSETGTDVKKEDASVVQSGTETVTSGEIESEEEPPFNGKEKFVIFSCCLFSVALCVVIGLYGNPNDRLKDKYKRARKQQLLQEKKKKEAEERAARRAAEEAKYAEELAQYEADVKAYEEAKAAKAAEKAAKKAAKAAKKK